MNKHMSTFAALAVSLLLLASCGSSGGGLGDILGGGTNQPSTNEIRGTVDRIDSSNRIIYLTNTYSSMLSSGGSASGNSATVHYDNQTYVDYQGRTYRPEDLERGDEISVRVSQSGNQLVADSVTVLRDVSGDIGSGSGTYTSNVRGTVTYIDSSRRTIGIDRGFGSTVTIDYETNTNVTFNNQTYRVEDLERGDEVDIRVRDLGNGRMVADSVSVLRSVSGSSAVSGSTVRGTVRSHNTSNRTIQLEQASWVSRFNTGAGTGTSVITIQYPSNLGVEVSGQTQSISGLERGDVIDVVVENPNASMPFARRIILVRDVRY